MKILQFLDHLIPYETFLNDLSSRIVRQLKADKDDPEFISQRKAYELFGRRNVERWKRQGKVVSYKRPGKVEYRTADLRLLQRTTQDYFDESQPRQAERPVQKKINDKYIMANIFNNGKLYMFALAVILYEI